MTWWLGLVIVVYLVGWVLLGTAMASVTDESQGKAFMIGALWPWFVALLVVGR